MEKQNVNMILTAAIIVLFIANVLFFLQSYNSIYGETGYWGETGLLFGFLFLIVFSIIISVVFSIILILFVYKKKIKRKLLFVILVILIILLIGWGANIILNSSVSGTKLYDYDSGTSFPIGQTRIYGDYVTWSGDNEVYLLNINDKTSTKIGDVKNGPVIYDNHVFFEDSNSIYQYTISTGNTKELVNGDGKSLDASGNNIIWFENQSIYLFNIQSEETMVIKSENITLPILIYDDYIVWREFVSGLSDEYWEYWFESRYGDYSSGLTGSGIYNIWIYDISTEEKSKALSGITQLGYSSSQIIDIYENEIAYTQNLSIYLYDISSDETTEIVQHSKTNDIINQKTNEFAKEGHIRKVNIFGDKIIYSEGYSIQMAYSGTELRCHDMSNGNNFEIEFCEDIYDNYIVGWYSPYSGGKTDGDYELYLIDLS